MKKYAIALISIIFVSSLAYAQFYDPAGLRGVVLYFLTAGNPTPVNSVSPLPVTIISGGSGGSGGAITGPLSSSTADSAGVAVTFAGTPPTGFVTPCSGAIGFQGEFDCLLSLANTSIPSGANVIGKTGIDQTTPGTTNAVQLIAGSSGGASGGSLLSAASTNATTIKSSAGSLKSLNWLQTTTTLMDIRLYDVASFSSSSCASATGLIANFVVQSNAVSPGGSPAFPPEGIAFANSIGMCITGANTNTDTTNAVTGLNVNWTFK